jgi:ferrous iron transport protein A
VAFVVRFFSLPQEKEYNRTLMVDNNLLQIPIGDTVRIQGFEGSKAVATKLRQYGLFVGDQARILRKAPFAGPVLLEVNGREIALSRGIALKILVERI